MVISHNFAEALAAERQRSLRAEAEAHHRAMEARLARHAAGMPALLARIAMRLAGQSAVVRIRPIRPADAPVLSEGFSRLSPQSRQLRFLAPKHALTSWELRYFTEVDHHDHEALVAVNRFGGQGLGVARYVRSHDDPESAEIAVTVVDEWQGRGLGTELVARLAERARCEGIRRLTALTTVGNARARKLLGKVGGTVVLVGRSGDTVSYEVTLPPAPAPARQSRWRVARPAPAGCGGV